MSNTSRSPDTGHPAALSMSGFVRSFEHIKALAARVLVTGAALLCAVQAAQAEAPERVVSMNLCTDQLAMMLAAEGQLLSVSRISLDPHVSPMAEEAKDYRINAGQAEEIYLMRPDLVLAGEFTPQATLDMLRGLGIRVETFGIT